MANTDAPHLYLVDGSGYIFRAYHALRPMTRPDGTPINAVFGFSQMLFKLLLDLSDGDAPSHLAVIFDAARKTFRSDIYPDYKAHRPPAPEDLVPQFPLIKDATDAFGVPQLEMPGFEADDIIATYATEARAKGWRVTIVSSDKDLMQLVDDTVTLYDSMKNRRQGIAEVQEKFGVGPDRVIDVQSLAGDSVDNVPGVPGIGIKTAAQLINEYGDLDTLLDRAGEITQPKRRENLIENREMAEISRALVTLKTDVPVTMGLDALVRREPDMEALLGFIDQQSFKSLRGRVVEAYGIDMPEAEDGTDLSAALETDYTTITTLEALDGWIAHARAKGTLALDTETTSLRIMEAELVGLSLSVEPGTACYVPLAHKNRDPLLDGPIDQLDKGAVLERLKPLLNDPAVMKLGQNMKYDLSILAREGVEVSPIDDSMVMSYVLDAGLHGHGMDELAALHMDITPVPYKDVVGSGKAQVTFDYVPVVDATRYAAEDADITLRLGQILKPRLATGQVRTVYETLERPLIPVLARMERAGIKVDAAALAKLSQDFDAGLKSLEAEIYSLAGHAFNINSPKQLGEILFDEMGLKGGKKSAKTGAWTTNVEVLERLAAEGHSLPEKVIEYRQFAKLKSTYTDALQRDINPATGRVHTSYHLAATTTGRLSSNDPNLQNIPIRTEAGRKIRQAFVAPKGHKLIAADYSQIELRLLAHIADIDALKTAFAEGQDIHALTASEVFDIPMEGMDPMVRRRAKAINFGIIYGISAFGLARQLKIGRADAQGYIDAYFEKFPGIRRYMDETIQFAKDHGYVTTLFGRKCHIKALTDKNPMQRGFGERAAINAPIQGAAADIIRRAMVRMDAALAEADLGDVCMLLQVHDELVFEAPEDKVADAIPVIQRVMEQAAQPAVDITVPLVVDAGVGDNWDEAH